MLATATVVAAMGLGLACGAHGGDAAPGGIPSGAEGGASDAGCGGLAPLDDSDVEGRSTNDAAEDASDLDVTPHSGGSGVNGSVVDLANGRPLPGRSVRIGSSTAVTDIHGNFSLDVASSTYDVVIVDADGSTISLYHGLTRRDPRLCHVPSTFTLPADHAGSIQGQLLGGPPFPIGPDPRDRVVVRFLSPDTETATTLAVAPGLSSGPAYVVRGQWAGPTSSAGVLAAVGAVYDLPDSGRGVAQYWAGRADASMTTGVMSIDDLPLAPAMTTHIAGHVTAPPAYPSAGVEAYYRLSSPVGRVTLPTAAATTADFEILAPDLATTLGGTLCISAASVSVLDGASIQTEQCGIAPDRTDLQLQLPNPPGLVPPGTSVGSGTQLSWRAIAGKVFVLKIESRSGTVTPPSIFVYTTNTSAAWPDLNAEGLPYVDGAPYGISVGVFAPYDNMDDFVASDGFGSPVRPLSSQAYSDVIPVTTP